MEAKTELYYIAKPEVWKRQKGIVSQKATINRYTNIMDKYKVNIVDKTNDMCYTHGVSN